MRIDLLLYRLRLAKSRSVAQGLVEPGHIRRNGRRIVKSSEEVAVGDVIALPLHGDIRVIEILALPTRRGPAAEARECYREIPPENANVSQEGGHD